jgi:hypothetical protein
MGPQCFPGAGKFGSALNLKREFLDFFFFMYDIQHCFICRPSDSTVSEDAGIGPRTVATTALAVRRTNHSARSHPLNFPRFVFWIFFEQDSDSDFVRNETPLIAVVQTLLIPVPYFIYVSLSFQ